jgi:glycosyltransferase involved in cell wall biosynthesis
MADTLEASIESIMAQIDDRFEVILIDDGSSDHSSAVGMDLANRYSNLHFIPLKRDSERRLGKTRNFSFEVASGEWCIFHLDTDDKVDTGLQEFVEQVERLSLLMPRDVLISGQQIHMAKRAFLLRHGPFNNIYRGEDRDLYMRLVRTSEWIVIRHKRFISRMNRSRTKLTKKNLLDNFDQVVTDLQAEADVTSYLWANMIKVTTIGLRVFLFRLLVSPLALSKARKRGSFSRSGYPSHIEFLAYRSANTKSLSEWFIHYGSTAHMDRHTRLFD